VLLACVYSDKLNVDADSIQDLIRMATNYQLEKMSMLCVDFLSAEVTADNALDLLQMSTTLGAPSEEVLEYIQANTEAVFESEGFLKLSRAALKVILSDDLLSIDEYPVYEAVLRWGRSEAKKTNLDEKTDLKAVLGDVLSLIRFPLLTISEIASQVAPSGLLDQEDLVSLFSYCSIKDTEARKLFKLKFNATAREGSLIPKNSRILKTIHKKDLSRLFEDKRLKLSLLYSGAADGFNASAFHTKCDMKGATLTVIQSGLQVFGGYNSENWAQTGNYTTSGSWLYSLQNPQKQPLKLLPNGTTQAYNGSGYGPTWGGGHDLHVNNNMKTASSNYTSPSAFTIVAPTYTCHTGSVTTTTLAGVYNFPVDEIEVFGVKYD